jgi:hypothetical protein
MLPRALHTFPSLLVGPGSFRAAILTATAFLACAATPAHAQQARDRAVELTATPASSPTRILLNWDAAPQPASGIWVYRRFSGATNWTLLASPGGAATSYTDNAVSTGVRYEYRVFRQTTDNLVASAYGYALAGIDAPLLDQRGSVVLVIDSSHAAALATELARFQRDLAGDGWTVFTESVAPTDTPASVRAKLQARRAATPDLKAAILLGRVPVPYSGDIRPDGHTDHQGAWPADTYYADLDGTWTDTTVNRTTATQSRNHNIPGDGKFDQNTLPAPATLAVGRIDMANLSGFSAGANSTELLRNYLRKNHEFRHRLGSFADIPRRALIDDHFGYQVGTQPEAPAAVAWRNFTPMFGTANITAADWFTTLETQSYLWAYGCGAGSFTSASGIGSSTNFKTQASRAVFNGIFGSYFGDWDSPTDPLLRSVLAGATDSLSLVSLWANRPEWVLHGLALGETIGDAYLRTVNNPGSYNDDFNTGYFNHYTDNPRGVHTALLGDPTLRLHPVAPPAAPSASRSSGASTDTIQLSWTAPSPTETGLLGYHVYRSASLLGLYTRLTSSPVSVLNYTDSAAPKTDLHYQVRAVVTTTSASGTYQNAGQAAFVPVPVAPPAAPASFSATPATATSIGLAWTPPSLADTHRLERSSTGASGPWTLVSATLPGDSATYTDTGLSPSTTYFYRIRSANAAGDGAWSATASATTFPDAALSLVLPTTDIAETSGSFTATVARTGTTGDQTVMLSSNDPRLTVPATVTIPAGQTSVSFTVTVNDDTLRNSSHTATLTAIAPAALIGESFSGALNSEIAGQNTGWGWGAAWTANNASAILVEPSLAYTKNGAIGAPGTRSARLTDAGSGGENRRNFPSKLSSGSVWVSTLLQRNSGNFNTYLIVRQNTGGGDWARVRYASNTLHWELEAGTGNKVQLLNSNPATGTVLYVVMQFDFTARKVRAWLSPEVSGATPVNAIGSGEVDMQSTLDGVSRLDFGNNSNADQFDEIRVATSFANLHATTTTTGVVTLLDDEDVPEPGPGVIEFTAPVFTTTEPVFTSSTASQTKTVTITARRRDGNEGAVSVDYVATAIESLSFAGENYNTGTGGVWREYQSSRPQVTNGAGTLSWAHGETGEKSFTLTLNADIIFTNFVPAANNLVEGIESLELFLARPKGGATLGDLSRARLDILDAQAPAGGQGVIQFGRPRFAAFENAGTMPVVLRRVQGSTGSVSATFTTSSSLLGGYGGAFSNPITPAVAGGDYTSVSQTVTWADGDSGDKIVHVPLIDNAAVQSATGSRGVRGIRFQLTAPSGGALTSVNEALGLILDDESEIYDVWIENLYGKLMSVRLPRHTPVVRGLVHFMPGTGGDWRPQILSPSHQAVADQWGFAISGQNANAFASTGPGGVAEFHNHLDALALFTGCPELRNAPVVFTGISAGGYASAASHGAVPDQVLGFVAHKGGSYEFRGTSQADTKPPIHETNLFTPGLIIAGGNDGTVPAQDIYDAFLQYRQTLPPGSQFTTAIDWNIGHTDTGGQGWAMAYLFIDELVRLRYPAGQLPGQEPGEIVDLHRIPHADTWLVQQVNGFLGNRRPDPALAPRNLQIRPAAGVADPGTDGIVLSERLARAYQAFSSLHANTYQSAVPFQSPLRITSHNTTHNQISSITLGQSTTLTLDPRGYTNFNRADFYFDNQLVGTRGSAPWSVTFTPPTSGVGLLRVVTSTNGGGETRYAFETLLVRDIPPYPPAAPTGLVATRPTASTASLTWTTVPFATGLQVQRSTAGAAGPWTTVANLDGDATAWSDANLVAAASYWYRLVATNPYGNSPASNIALLLVETATPLVHDPFSDGGVTNGADLDDVAWSVTGNTLAVVTDTTLDPVSPNRVAEFSINTANKDEYATFALPSAVTLAVDEGLRVSFRLRHTGTPRADASATGVSLAFTPNAGSAPWNNANNREYFLRTSYGQAGALGEIRKTGTGGAQLLNVGTQTLATGLASINAGTDVATVSLEVLRTGENSVRIRYRLNNGPAQEVTDTSDVVTTFNRVFLRFRTRTDAAAPAFRIDDVTVQRLTPAIATPLQLWQTTHFTAAQLADPTLGAGVWGNQADPDGDGLPNLLEYALGLNPTSPSGTDVPAAALNPAGTHLQLTFQRARSELTYEVLASSNLTDWTVIATNPGQVGDFVTVTDSVSATPRRFLRLRVTVP